MEATIGDETYTVEAGDLVKLPRNVPHAIRCTGTSATKTLWTVVPAGKMEQLFRALGALRTGQPLDPEQIGKIFTEHDITPVPPSQG